MDQAAVMIVLVLLGAVTIIALVFSLDLIKKYLCGECVPCHKFNPWQDTKQIGDERYPYDVGIVQERRCKNCQYVQLHLAHTYKSKEQKGD